MPQQEAPVQTKTMTTIAACIVVALVTIVIICTLPIELGTGCDGSIGSVALTAPSKCGLRTSVSVPDDTVSISGEKVSGRLSAIVEFGMDTLSFYNQFSARRIQLGLDKNSVPMVSFEDECSRANFTLARDGKTAMRLLSVDFASNLTNRRIVHDLIDRGDEHGILNKHFKSIGLNQIMLRRSPVRFGGSYRSLTGGDSIQWMILYVYEFELKFHN